MNNRPSYSEYTFEHILIRDSIYVEDLEEYCDKLEKALDKACYELAELILHSDNEHLVYGMTKDDIREWCLKDE